MGTESNSVLGADAANFVFNGWDLKVSSDYGIGDIPRCISYEA
jgi:hypothetical protein